MVAYNHFYTDNIYASIYLKEKTNKNLIICSVFFIQSNEKKHLSQDFMQYTP